LTTRSVLTLYLPGLLGPLPRPVPAGELTRQPALEAWLARSSRGGSRGGSRWGNRGGRRWGSRDGNSGPGRCSEYVAKQSSNGAGQFGGDAGQLDSGFSLESFAPPQDGGGALAWLAEGGDPAGFVWARVSPVCLSPDASGARLLTVDLTEDESGELFGALEEHLRDYGLSLLRSGSGYWFLKGDELPPGGSDPRYLVGSCVGSIFSRSPELLAWSRIWTEMEMLLFAHPLNRRRQERGLPPVNSLWLWGVGRCPQPPAKLPWQRVVSVDPEWRGWGRLAGGVVGEMMHEAVYDVGGRVMIHCPWVYQALAAEDWGGWLEAVEYVETHLISPAVSSLNRRYARRRGWDEVELWVDAKGPASRLKRANLWRLWRRKRPFEEWVRHA
jgi:hypothetical protein